MCYIAGPWHDLKLGLWLPIVVLYSNFIFQFACDMTERVDPKLKTS